MNNKKDEVKNINFIPLFPLYSRIYSAFFVQRFLATFPTQILKKPITFPCRSLETLFESSAVHRSEAPAMSFRIRRPNASSGMGVADQSKRTFLELKKKKVHRYVIFKIDEKKNEVVVEKTGGPTESYNDFAKSLPMNDCRYAVYDFDFVTSENCQKSKIFFIAWSPEISRIRARMLYATSKDSFKRALDGVHYEIQATDPTEMDLQVIRDRAH